MKFVLILGLTTLVAFAAGKSTCLGCAQEVEGPELERLEEDLKNSLAEFAAGDGPYFELVEIISATRQLVAGTLDKIKAELKNQQDNKKLCDIEIWSRPSLKNGTRTTFICPGENKIVKFQSAY